jgi:muramoyltetrapeptide carboxypeptidase
MPPYLKAGDTIGITCPAGPVSSGNLGNCLKAMKSWGLNVRYGNTINKQWQRYAGTDAERAADFQELLDDDSINAIIFGKGGYGTMRIIDQVNWDKFRRKPKWLVGFSDITTVHLHVHAISGIPTIHGDMTSGLSLYDKDASSKSLHDALFGKPIAYVVKGHSRNREGNCAGLVVGGNLSLLQACSGSVSDINTDGKILFIEDVHEYKYCIDRMLMHLKRSGKLEKIAGLIVGGFTATRDEGDYRQSVEELIWEKVKDYDYPVCFNFPAGHIGNNLALKLGVKYDLSVSRTDVILNEKPTEILVPPVNKDSSVIRTAI